MVFVRRKMWLSNQCQRKNQKNELKRERDAESARMQFSFLLAHYDIFVAILSARIAHFYFEWLTEVFINACMCVCVCVGQNGIVYSCPNDFVQLKWINRSLQCKELCLCRSQRTFWTQSSGPKIKYHISFSSLSTQTRPFDWLCTWHLSKVPTKGRAERSSAGILCSESSSWINYSNVWWQCFPLTTLADREHVTSCDGRFDENSLCPGSAIFCPGSAIFCPYPNDANQ